MLNPEGFRDPPLSVKDNKSKRIHGLNLGGRITINQMLIILEWAYRSISSWLFVFLFFSIDWSRFGGCQLRSTLVHHHCLVRWRRPKFYRISTAVDDHGTICFPPQLISLLGLHCKRACKKLFLLLLVLLWWSLAFFFRRKEEASRRVFSETQSYFFPLRYGKNQRVGPAVAANVAGHCISPPPKIFFRPNWREKERPGFFLAGRVFSGVQRGVEAENLVMSTRDGFSPAGFFRE